MADEKTNSIQIFSPRAERLNLIFPLLGIVISTFEILLIAHFTKSAKFFLIMTFTALFFASGVHYMFTFTLLAFSPPFKKFWAEKRSKEIPRLLFLLVLVAGVVGFYYVAQVHRLPTRLPITLFFLGGVLFTSANKYHALRQHLGISLVYNAKRRMADMPPSDRDALQFSERWEKRLYTFLAVTQITQFVVFDRFFHTDLVGVLPFFDHPYVMPAVVGIQTVVACFIAAFIVMDRHIAHAPRNKTVFHLRLFLLPLSSFSYLSHLFMRGSHGLEYFLILRKMLTFSDRITKRKIIVSTVLLCAAIATSTFILTSHDVLKTHYSFLLICVLITFQSVAGSWHYLLDRVIYKMQDPVSRRLIGPLLTHSENPPPLFADLPVTVDEPARSRELA